MNSCLEDFKRGASYYDDGTEDIIPKDFDRQKFDRGRTFFKDHTVSCLLGMIFSLVCGLSVRNLLDVLVATGKSSKPRDSLIRYSRTVLHVVRWHYGDIMNSYTSAGKSIRIVRQVHNNAREFMRERTKGNGKNSNRVWISQYDMSLVQYGFIRAIIMYPAEFGIRCSKEDLDDYVYFWRCVGFFLGIKDSFNICCGGYDVAYKLCKEIEHSVLLPALKDPPAEFIPMANAFVEGIKMLIRVGIASVESILILSFEQMGDKRPQNIKFSLTDRFKICFFRGFVNSLYYIPGLSLCLSKLSAFVFSWSRIS